MCGKSPLACCVHHSANNNDSWLLAKVEVYCNTVALTAPLNNYSCFRNSLPKDFGVCVNFGGEIGQTQTEIGRRAPWLYVLCNSVCLSAIGEAKRSQRICIKTVKVEFNFARPFLRIIPPPSLCPQLPEVVSIEKPPPIEDWFIYWSGLVIEARGLAANTAAAAAAVVDTSTASRKRQTLLGIFPLVWLPNAFTFSHHLRSTKWAAAGWWARFDLIVS